MPSPTYFLPYALLQAFLDRLIHAGYQIQGPQIINEQLVYAPLTQVNQLPWGIRDEQGPGQYRLVSTEEHQAFGFSNAPQALKPLLFKPTETVWRVNKEGSQGLRFEAVNLEPTPTAILGARACDLAALARQDQVFLESEHPYVPYQKRRESLFLIGVQCGYASNNCFCVSAGCGPKIQAGFDLCFTELDSGFLVQIGSVEGDAILAPLNLALASTEQQSQALEVPERAARMQTKTLPFNNQQALEAHLFQPNTQGLHHPHWKKIGEKCLACGNCTAVCPTCFCHRETEEPAMDGQSSEHGRSWDSCFTSGHSYITGKLIRESTDQRYKQWLTHKVGSWFSQFGQSGCVGCGRCISACPVGIDLTEELQVLTQAPKEDQ
jgi:sulfhydrogenase subunit beta (sulfur reductase)